MNLSKSRLNRIRSLSTAFVCLGLHQATAASVVVAEYLSEPGQLGRFSGGAGNSSDNGGIFENTEGQTFVALQSGFLERIDATVDIRPGVSTAPLKVCLMSVVDGVPTSILASALVPVSEIPDELPDLSLSNSFNISALFANGPALSAGTTYAILFSSEGGPANYGIWGYSDFTDHYADGVTFSSQNSPEFTMNQSWQGDYFFRVVAAVPEPGAWAAWLYGYLYLLASTPILNRAKKFSCDGSMLGRIQ